MDERSMLVNYIYFYVRHVEVASFICYILSCTLCLSLVVLKAWPWPWGSSSTPHEGLGLGLTLALTLALREVWNTSMPFFSISVTRMLWPWPLRGKVIPLLDSTYSTAYNYVVNLSRFLNWLLRYIIKCIHQNLTPGWQGNTFSPVKLPRWHIQLDFSRSLGCRLSKNVW